MGFGAFGWGLNGFWWVSVGVWRGFGVSWCVGWVVVGSGGFGEFVLDWLWWALVGSGGFK